MFRNILYCGLVLLLSCSGYKKLTSLEPFINLQFILVVPSGCQMYQNEVIFQILIFQTISKFYTSEEIIRICVVKFCNNINVFWLAYPKISKMRNSYETRHFNIHLENEMLKNQKILKIGLCLGVPICHQSFTILRL